MSTLGDVLGFVVCLGGLNPLCSTGCATTTKNEGHEAFVRQAVKYDEEKFSKIEDAGGGWLRSVGEADSREGAEQKARQKMGEYCRDNFHAKTYRKPQVGNSPEENRLVREAGTLNIYLPSNVFRTIMFFKCGSPYRY